MKQAFVNSLIALYKAKPFVFLTGDLGFNMLEPLRDIMGARFINCGVAEQNMVSMAAGIAKTGESVWVYSIAPFLYARCFEQIRNDIAIPNLPVKLVGMGGGYHYGDLGPSHWALEDYGLMCSLPNMKCHVPCSANSIAWHIDKCSKSESPIYLRLGRDEGSYKNGGMMLRGQNGNVISIGPLAYHLAGKLSELPEMERPNIFMYHVLPALELPEYAFNNGPVVVVEEHVKHGGLAEQIRWLTDRQICSIHAELYRDGPYGDQQYMRERAGITATAVLEALNA